MLRGVPGSSPITDPRLRPKRTRSKGPFLCQHYPASTVVWPSPTPVRPAALRDVGVASPSQDGSPPMTRITLPTCRAPYPGGSRRVPVSIASPLTRPSPFPRRGGIRIFTFEAFSGFTRATARWIAQPPKAAFVTRLQPSQLPDQTARQLPDQSTTLWVEPSSTGDPRRRGALPSADIRSLPGRPLSNPGIDLIQLIAPSRWSASSLFQKRHTWFLRAALNGFAFFRHAFFRHCADPVQ